MMRDLWYKRLRYKQTLQIEKKIPKLSEILEACFYSTPKHWQSFPEPGSGILDTTYLTAMWRRSWNCSFKLQMKSSLTTHLANQQLLHEKLDGIQFYKIFQTLDFYGCSGSISLACLSCIAGWGRRRNPIIVDAKCKAILRIRQQEFQSSLQIQRARQSSNINAMFLQFFFSSWKWFLVSLDLSSQQTKQPLQFSFSLYSTILDW